MRRHDHRLGQVFLAGAFIASLAGACGPATPTPSPTPRVGPTAPPEAAASRSHGPQGDLVATGWMTMGRSSHTATLLPDGKVLIAGGESFAESRSAELYDPRAGTFTATGSMVTSHMLGTATPLLDGRVLFVGGWELQDGSGWSAYDATRRDLAPSAELYDPKTGRFTKTGSPAIGRYSHTATRLADGRVLIAGGVLGANDNPDASATATAEIYDPATGTFSGTGSMATPRWDHSATLLKDGRVLMTGSWHAASAELYDPAKGEFTSAGSMKLTMLPHVATLLRDGRVLIVGGGNPDASSSAAEIYDPATGEFTATGSMLHTCNFYGPYGTLLDSPAVLADGRVLVPDVDYLAGQAAAVELYDPATGTFTQGPQMTLARSGFTETLLADGRVLFTGNSNPVYPMDMAPPTDSDTLARVEADRASAEIYVP